jgi:hypothetical protein
MMEISESRYKELLEIEEALNTGRNIHAPTLGREIASLKRELESAEAAAAQVMQNEESAQRRVKELDLYIKEMHDLDYPTKQELTALIKLKNLQIALDQDRLEENNSYKIVVEDALTCWEMVATGDAKADLNNLICMEQQVCLDPAVSLDARTLIRLGRIEAARKMLEMMEAFQTSYDLIGYEVETVGTIAKQFSAAITRHFDLEI